MNRREMLKAAAVVAGGVCLPKDVTAKTLQVRAGDFRGKGSLLTGCAEVAGVDIWGRDQSEGHGPGSWLIVVRAGPGAVILDKWDGHKVDLLSYRGRRNRGKATRNDKPMAEAMAGAVRNRDPLLHSATVDLYKPMHIPDLVGGFSRDRWWAYMGEKVTTAAVEAVDVYKGISMPTVLLTLRNCQPLKIPEWAKA